MSPFVSTVSRRRFLQGITLGSAAFFSTPGLFAAELARTPAMTEGPFYPDRLPLDTDNDLIVLGNSLTPAVGTVTHLTGRILTPTGSPVRDAVVEIWQCDARGVYLHTADSEQGSGPQRRDRNFQGFGRFLTGSSGEYYFRTIKPIAYPGRTPHIHFKIRKADKELLTTQCYVKGERLNDRDGIYRDIRDPKARSSVTVEFAPLKDSRIGELAARFDIVVGMTPEG